MNYSEKSILIDNIISCLIDYLNINLIEDKMLITKSNINDIVLINTDVSLNEEDKKKIRSIFKELKSFTIHFTKKNIEYNVVFEFHKEENKKNLSLKSDIIDKNIYEMFIKENQQDKLNYYFITKNII